MTLSLALIVFGACLLSLFLVLWITSNPRYAMSWFSRKVKHVKKLIRHPKRLLRAGDHLARNFVSGGLDERLRKSSAYKSVRNKLWRTVKPHPTSYAAPIVLSQPSTASVTTSARRISDLMR